MEEKMTNKESAEWLIPIKNLYLDESNFSQISEAMDVAIDLLKKGQWIPCSEMLPKEEGEYVVTCSDRWGSWVTVSEYYPKIIDSSPWETMGKVIAWMPLPSPYDVKNGF